MIKPMLAQNWHKQKSKIVYPCIVQPKLDGARCIATKVSETEISYMSRTGKPFQTLEHLTTELLQRLQVGESFDGEIYIHHEDFSDLMSLLKRQQPDSFKLEYWVYDFVIDDVPFVSRTARVGAMTDMIKSVPSRIAHSEQDVDKWYDKYDARGYEGIMVRNINSNYKHGRSMDLQKYKRFIDEEFEIIGGVSGKGKATGAVTFICKTYEGKTFNVVPALPYEVRKDILSDIDNYIGKMLTVQFFEKSKLNIPRFPVGKAIRDYE